MTFAAELTPHPAHPAAAVRRIGAEIAAGRGTLRLRFRLEGEMAGLAMPAPAAARRRDGLWQHSCFEAFLRPDASDSYHEFNFSPSGEWAAYRFAGRRAGQAPEELPTPAIRFSATADGCELTAIVDIAALPALARATAFDAGLAAVVESTDGTLSYWSLGHGGAKPDFHDPTTFRRCVTPK